MMNPTWKLTETYDSFELEVELTDSELIAISIALRHVMDESADDVYSQAWRKLQPAVDRAIERDR